jgi:hypothetical protein
VVGVGFKLITSSRWVTDHQREKTLFCCACRRPARDRTECLPPAHLIERILLNISATISIGQVRVYVIPSYRHSPLSLWYVKLGGKKAFSFLCWWVGDTRGTRPKKKKKNNKRLFRRARPTMEINEIIRPYLHLSKKKYIYISLSRNLTRDEDVSRILVTFSQ